MPILPPDDQQPARVRQTRASCYAESSRGTFGISSHKFRVGAPALHPLPLLNLWTTHFPPLKPDKFIERAREVLVAHGLGDNGDLNIEFLGRMVPGAPWTTQPTLLVCLSWHDDSSAAVWEQIVVTLKQYADDVAGPHGIDVSVEIMAPELIRRKHISPLANDDDFPKLAADWPVIMAEVVRILECFPATASFTNVVSLFRLGYHPDSTRNPRTVYVSLDFESDPGGWPPVIQTIQGYLDGLEHDLHVHLEHNVLNHLSFPLAPPRVDDHEMDLQTHFNFDPNRDYQTAVVPGVDIGASRYITREEDQSQIAPLVGTLGCYLEIQCEGVAGWTRLALTNNHVVRPALSGYRLGSSTKSPVRGSPLWHADHEGFGPDGIELRALMEHPTRAKHNFAVDSLRRAIARQGTSPPALCDKLAEKLAFFEQDRKLFGQVWAGSGCTRRTATNGRLDWALIEPTRLDRLPPPEAMNLLPDFAQWCAAGVSPEWFPDASTWGAQLKLSPPLSTLVVEGGTAPATLISALSHGDVVYKIGSSSKITMGQFQKTMTRCRIGDEKYMELENAYSSEYAVIGVADNTPDSRFGDFGDSGAVVFDGKGTAVGLVLTGQSPQQCHPDCVWFVTPIEEVFGDIMAASGGDITGVRVAGLKGRREGEERGREIGES